MRRLLERVALVTGAGNGLGRAIAHRLATDGAKVFVTDVDSVAADTVAAEIVAAGGQASSVSADVSRGQDVSALMRRVAASDGRLDILVNNAGLNVRADFRHLSEADWVKVREVNLDGVVRVAREGFELLRRSGNASLINIASIMGDHGMRQLVAYSATKGAVVALTKGLAVEFAPFNIRVNCVSPGFVETALTARVLKVPAFAKTLVDKTPMRRFGRPEEIAAAAAFLASDEASFVTGAELVVDGGMTAQL
ncbi:MAG: SDR family NAD(P)-dependent oxidoreductase [Hyphomicrobiaceae bacterium]|nr:SDR family NAD(P)-dependent oxidoreductase [Hyphomicrobiaceae bacterium]